MPRTFLALAFLPARPGRGGREPPRASRSKPPAVTSPNCRSCSSRSSRRNPASRNSCRPPKARWGSWKAGRHPAAGDRPQRGRAGAPERGEDHPRRCSHGTAAPDRPAGPRRLSERSPNTSLLLNQQNPEKFSRTLTHYDYLNKARLEQPRQLQRDTAPAGQRRGRHRSAAEPARREEGRPAGATRSAGRSAQGAPAGTGC